MTQREYAPLLMRWVEDYHALLYRYAYRLCGSSADAEDLTQQTYLVAAAKMNQLRDVSLAKAWLFSILRNHYLNGLRQEQRINWETLNEGIPTEDARVHADIDDELLQRVLGELPEEFRSALILYYFDEFSYEEIADHLGIAMGTVMSRLSRGKAHLRRRLVEYAEATPT